MNHHYLMGYVQFPTARLMWGNFAHLFSVSFVPFVTAWIADTHLAAVPVAVYASIFMLVNATYLVLCREGVDRPNLQEISPRVRRMMRIRSIVTLGVFAFAALVALRFPLAGMTLIFVCLILYVRPEAPGRDSQFNQGQGR
jgi:uncharacterized membrane protein